MELHEIEEWIATSLALGGNDFIDWDEINQRVSPSTLVYIEYLIALENQRVIFKIDDPWLIQYTKQQLIKSLRGE